jgi:hypothetical protein
MMVCASVWPVYGQDAAATEEEAPALPESVDMSLGAVNSEFAMPKVLGGQETERGRSALGLEERRILMAENSDLYNIDANAIAESASFEGPPNINWEIKKRRRERQTEHRKLRKYQCCLKIPVISPILVYSSGLTTSGVPPRHFRSAWGAEV